MSLNNDFIEAVKKHLPEGKVLSSYLLDVLPLGKEAIYRRINGEVSISLNEAIIISQKLHISLDQLLQNRAMLELNLIDKGSPEENYMLLLKRQITLFEKLHDSQNACVYAAFNFIPYTFFLDYKLITKFQLYKYIFRYFSPTNKINKLSDFVVSDEIRKLQTMCRKALSEVKYTQYILNKRIFVFYAEDIIQFYKMGMIDGAEKEVLKQEILALIDEVEMVAISGKRVDDGNEIVVYLSNINFDSSYIYYEYEDSSISFFKLFSINGLYSENKKVCVKQKEWLDSIQNTSTKITLSNALFRKKYFTEQRREINRILK